MKKNKLVILSMFVILLTMVNFTRVFVSNAWAKEEDYCYTCRLYITYLDEGKVTHDCEVAENPPYWGCIGCPYSY